MKSCNQRFVFRSTTSAGCMRIRPGMADRRRHVTLAASTGRAFQISLPGRLAGSGFRWRSARGADEAEIDIKPHSAVLKPPPEIDTGSMWMKLTDRWHFRDVSGWQRPLTPGKRTGRVCCVVPCYNVEKYCGAVVTAAACNVDDVPQWMTDRAITRAEYSRRLQRPIHALKCWSTPKIAARAPRCAPPFAMRWQTSISEFW